MKNHKEMFEALLAGETLESSSREYKLIKDIVHSLDITEYSDGRWVELHKPPNYESVKIKPKTININGFEVPKPLREAPSDYTEVYWPCLSSRCQIRKGLYQTKEYFTYLLKNGVLHLTPEAAILHGKALLSFTKSEEQQ